MTAYSHRGRGRKRKRKGSNRVRIPVLFVSAFILLICVLSLLAVTVIKHPAGRISEKKKDAQMQDDCEVSQETPVVATTDILPEDTAVKMSDLNLTSGAGSAIPDAGKEQQSGITDPGDENADESAEGTGDTDTGVSEEPPRILFIGDSRTIDMFADSDEEIRNHDGGDGIAVYARHGCGFNYLDDAIGEYGMDNFDVLVTWMGANDAGDFRKYGEYYDRLLESGKNLIVCTVGPTDDTGLVKGDHPDYENNKMVAFNTELVRWAGENGIKVIDLYGYINSSETVKIDPEDGIHYLPRPTTELWDHIKANIR